MVASKRPGTRVYQLPPPTLRGVLMRWNPCVFVTDFFQG